MDMKDEINAIGFEFSVFGRSAVMINGVPADLKTGNEKELFEGFVEQFKKNASELSISTDENVARAIAQRSALKEGAILEVEEMSALMWSSAFGITSPSTISLEYLATGKQLYLRQTADNQDDIQASLLEQKIAFPLDALVAAETYPANPAVGKLYDGNQAVRFRKLFAGLGLQIRSAQYDDCRLLYRWATDPAVRAQSFSTEDIKWEQHKAWFVGQLVRPDRRFYVCENKDGPVGLVRFSIEGEAAMLGYLLGTRVRGKGYGVSMVHFATERLRAEIAAVQRINAYVKKDNMASRITLTRLGYTELPTEDYPDSLKFILDV
jgi:RimJ/RimL family protein N-acetyltransferase